MLSIIIPTLNEEKYLPTLLDSIKKQDYTDYEIIVADAGSQDKTVEIAKEYKCTIVKGGLLPAGRNRGAEAAKGDILLFADADAFLPPHFIKNTIKEFKKRNLGIAGFPIFPLSNKKVDKFWFKFFNIYVQLIHKISPHAVAVIMSKKEVHSKINGFDEKIVFVEDYSYTREAAKVSTFGLVDQPFFVSVRRYDKDGRFNVYTKYALAELHIVFLGPIRSDVFKYKFNHYKDNNN